MEKWIQGCREASHSPGQALELEPWEKPVTPDGCGLPEGLGEVGSKYPLL